MFGYTTMYPGFQTWKMHRCCRNYYCGVCFGLEKNYGQLSRMLLNYDVTLMALILGCHVTPLQERYRCFGRCREKRCVFRKQSWKQIAAMDILLVNEKLKDDINDDNSMRARLGKVLLGGKIKRAQEQFPQMADAIAKGYEDMYTLEKQGSGIRQIEDRFAKMMIGALAACRALSEWEQKYITCIARWIYYIDALDDYEKDFKEKKFNALKRADADTFYAYTKKYLPVIASDLRYIYQDIPYLVQNAKANTVEKGILLTMIQNNMALTTSRVITRQPVRRFKVGSVWDGAGK